MVISPSGEVLTGYHVIAEAMENSMPIHVLLGDGQYATTTVALHDKASDVAVLTIDEGHIHSSLPYTPIDTIAKVGIGDRKQSAIHLEQAPVTVLDGLQGCTTRFVKIQSIPMKITSPEAGMSLGSKRMRTTLREI